MTKTYSRNIFSGKQIPFIGISNGHGKLFRGNSVEFSMNVIYKGAIQMRSGAIRVDSYEGRIHNGASGLVRGLCVGKEIRAEIV